MDVWYFSMELVMLLGGAFLLGALAQRLKQSPIVGYLLTGTIIGPWLFNAEAVNQSAELGVSLLLFSIGLEFSFRRLKQMGRLAFGGGALQVGGTLAIVSMLLLFWAPFSRAVTIGAVVALSSTAVVMRVLVNRSEIDSIHGRSCLAILLFQDIAIVPLVIMVSLFTTEASSLTGIALHILKVVASAGGLGLILFLLLYKAVPRLLATRGVFANRELTALLAVAVGLGASWGAHAMGLSPALGAFLAGLLLGESPFATQIRADIGVARTIMVTLFFASIGMLAKPVWFLLHLHWIVGAASAIFILKSGIVFFIVRWFGLNRRQSLATGISLAQVGEFSFVLAAAASTGDILTGDHFDLVVSVIILLMFAGPYMVTQAFPLADRLLNLTSGRSSDHGFDNDSDESAVSHKVLVIGLGPAGQEVVRHLLTHQMTPVIIDANPQSRTKAGELGIEIHLGDAVHEDVLLHAGFKDACMAVVTVPDPSTVNQIVTHMRGLRPRLPIAVRCRYHRHLENVKKAGATIIVDEETRVGHDLAHAIVDFMQETSGEILACRLAGKPVASEAAQDTTDAEKT